MSRRQDNEKISPRRSRHADGRADAALLATGGAVVGARRRRRADAADAARRTADRLSRQRGPGRHHGSSLPASLRVAVLRPQRGRRPALRLSRLEIRRRRQLPRHAERAGRPGFQATRSRPRPTRPSSATASSGSIWASAQSRRRCRRSRRRCCPQSEIDITCRAARMQLAAGARRRYRHLAFRLPACRQVDGRRHRRPTI